MVNSMTGTHTRRKARGDGPTRRTLLLTAGGLAVLGTGVALARRAPVPLDLGRLTLVFEDNFRTLDVTARGPGSKWIAHTPWNGDFGDAPFTDPQPGFPFMATPTGLKITARKGADGRWQSGLLASVDPDGRGFAQQYGYFEMRAKLPDADGVWPAFWLDSFVPKESNDPSIEIDALEYYGRFPGAFQSSVHVWPHDHSQAHVVTETIHVEPHSLCDAFHTYGVSIDKDWIVIYLDREEKWRTPTPAAHRHKLMILLNLALGGGWPIDDTPSPSVFEVDYVRAYAWKA